MVIFRSIPNSSLSLFLGVKSPCLYAVALAPTASVGQKTGTIWGWVYLELHFPRLSLLIYPRDGDLVRLDVFQSTSCEPGSGHFSGKRQKCKSQLAIAGANESRS
jgi:hypothetical protein